MDTSIKAFFAYFYFAAGNSLSNIWIANEKYNGEIDIEVNFPKESNYDIFFRGDKPNIAEKKINFGKSIIQFRLKVLKEMGFDFSKIQEVVEAVEVFDQQKFSKISTRYRNFLADDIERDIECPFNKGVKIVDQYNIQKNELLLRIHLLIILMISDYHLEIYIKKLNKLIQETDQLDTFNGPFIIPKEERNKPDKDGNKINWASIQKKLEQFKDPLNKREIEGNTTLEIDESDWKNYKKSINPNYENRLVDKYVQVRSVTNENDSIPKEVQIYDLLIEILKSEELLNNDEYKTLIKNNTKGQLKKHKGKLLFKEFDSIENGISKTLRFVLGQELMLAIILLNGHKDKKPKIKVNSIFESYKKRLDRLEEIREFNDRKFAPRNIKQIPNRDNFYQNESYSRENPEELVAYEDNEDYEGYNFNELYRKAVKNITRLGVSLNNIQDKEEEKTLIDESKEHVTNTYIEPSIENLNSLMEYFQVNIDFLISEKRLTKDILIRLNKEIIMKIHNEVDDEVFFKYKKRALKPQKREKHSNLVTINASQLYRILGESNADLDKIKKLKTLIEEKTTALKKVADDIKNIVDDLHNKAEITTKVDRSVEKWQKRGSLTDYKEQLVGILAKLRDSNINDDNLKAKLDQINTSIETLVEEYNNILADLKDELKENKISYSNIFNDHSEITFKVSHKFNKPYLNIAESIVKYCENKYDLIRNNTKKYDIYGYISKSQYRISNENVIESINNNVLGEIKTIFAESSPNQVNAYIGVIQVILEQKWHSIEKSEKEKQPIKNYRNKIMHLDLFKYTENEVVEGFNRQELENLINQELARKKSKQDTNYQIEFYRNKRFGNLFKIKNNGE